MNSKVFIIAELSANHNNDFDTAVKTIEAIARTGADAVKVQTYTANSLSLDVKNEYFKPIEKGLWKGYRPYELYQEASMPYEWQPKLQKVARELGLEFFSTPFDPEGVDFLESLDVPRYKIASLEITDIPLIEYAASKGKPMIISTGVAEIEDIERALEACRNVGNEDITLLKCTSDYPAEIKDANLKTIPDMKERFGVKVGVSDHTPGHTVPVVAVALRAEVVEKHIILNRSMGGPDAGFSMEPEEFKQMVSAVREAEQALGEVSYRVSEKDKNRRRSLFIVKDVEEGEKVSGDNVRSIRPGVGMHPGEMDYLLGKAFIKSYPKGKPLREDMTN